MMWGCWVRVGGWLRGVGGRVGRDLCGSVI